MTAATRIEDVEAALRKHRGLVSKAADELGITHQAVSKRVKTSERLRAVVEESRERRVDHAEYKLDEAIERGEAWSIAMVLKTLGKDRGYVERTEQQTSGDLTVRVEYVDDANPAVAEAP